METYKEAVNPLPPIAALRSLLPELLEYARRQTGFATPEEIAKWEEMLFRMPELPTAEFEGHTIFTPAESFNPFPINLEDPQLYGVFPYPIARLGTPELEIGRNTFHYDPFKIRMDVCWGQTEIWAAKLGETEHARHLIVAKLRDASLRFPAFWGPGPDWVPDMDHGGAGAIGLQEMLMQTDDEKILLFPAWPKNWDVEAKLHAPFQTVVEIKAKNGKLRELKITPESRRKDVVVLGGIEQAVKGA
jgi:hypothetical protein